MSKEAARKAHPRHWQDPMLKILPKFSSSVIKKMPHLFGGYILRQQGLSVILETSLEKAIERCSTKMLDLVVLDLDVDHEERMEFYQKFRGQTLESLAHMVEKSEKVRDCSR